MRPFRIDMATSVEPQTSAAPAPAPASLPTTPSSGPVSPALLRGVALGFGLVALAAAGLWFWRSSTARKERFAEQAFEKAAAEAEGGNLAKAASELQKVMDTYKGTEAAAAAALSLNQVRLQNGQAQLAVDGLKGFLASGGAGASAADAQALLAAALENSGKPAEAAEAYRKAAELTTVDEVKGTYLLDAGRALASAGKADQAQATYREVIEKLPKTVSKLEAEVRLAELTKGRM